MKQQVKPAFVNAGKYTVMHTVGTISDKGAVLIKARATLPEGSLKKAGYTYVVFPDGFEQLRRKRGCTTRGVHIRIYVFLERLSRTAGTSLTISKPRQPTFPLLQAFHWFPANALPHRLDPAGAGPAL